MKVVCKINCGGLQRSREINKVERRRILETREYWIETTNSLSEQYVEDIGYALLKEIIGNTLAEYADLVEVKGILSVTLKVTDYTDEMLITIITEKMLIDIISEKTEEVSADAVFGLSFLFPNQRNSIRTNWH